MPNVMRKLVGGVLLIVSVGTVVAQAVLVVI